MNDNPSYPSLERLDETQPLFGFKLSVLGHFLLFFFVFVKSFVFPGNSSPYVPVLKVDLVELPDVLKKDLSTTPQSKLTRDISKILKAAEQDAKRLKAETQEPAEKDEMLVKPKSASEKAIQNKNRRALDRIKALAKMQEPAAPESQVDKKNPKLLINKGNILSPGTSLSPDAKEAANANYLDSIRDLLHQNSFLPAWIAKLNLRAQVLIRIDATGNLRELRMVKSSENVQFDDAVKQAIRLSHPFPSPPAELKDEILSHGILLGFPL